MKIKGNRFVTSILAASMLSGTFFVPASAGELEGESAIAGMAVTLNNYYAGEETPDEAILFLRLRQHLRLRVRQKPKSQKPLWPLLLLSLQMLLM